MGEEHRDPPGFIVFVPRPEDSGSHVHLLELLEDGVDAEWFLERLNWFLDFEDYLQARR